MGCNDVHDPSPEELEQQRHREKVKREEDRQTRDRLAWELYLVVREIAMESKNAKFPNPPVQLVQAIDGIILHWPRGRS